MNFKELGKEKNITTYQSYEIYKKPKGKLLTLDDLEQGLELDSEELIQEDIAEDLIEQERIKYYTELMKQTSSQTKDLDRRLDITQV